MISLDFSSHAPLIHVHTDYSKVSVYFENGEGLDLKPLCGFPIADAATCSARWLVTNTLLAHCRISLNHSLSSHYTLIPVQ